MGNVQTGSGERIGGRFRVFGLIALALLAAGCHDRGAKGGSATIADLAALQAVSADQAWDDPALRTQAIHAGRAGYVAQCAQCHGADLKGAPGKNVPNLTDAHWLYAGQDIDSFVMRASDIENIILHGIRAGDPKGLNYPPMPARGTGNSLDAQEISDVTEYVLKLSGQPSDAAKAAAGQEVFDGEGGCYDCHTPDGLGDEAIGAANLREPRGWLYGSTRADILATVTLGRESICPAFAGKVDATMARAMAVFVLSKAQTLRAIVPLKPSPGVQERPRS